MKRYRQTLKEVVAELSAIETTWIDDHSAAVLSAIGRISVRDTYSREHVSALFSADFKAAQTVVRLVLGMSRDEFTVALKDRLGSVGGVGVLRFNKDREAYLDALDDLSIRPALGGLVNRPVDWKDILEERLRFGRGSAIKGQNRGRSLEDAIESIVSNVFGAGSYETRCRFVGANGTETEKADFAIPSKDDPRILIECKGYGATGSKQTDVLGDIERIAARKRSDTHLLLVADGVSWKERLNDLRKLIAWQNEGKISRIYTQMMAVDLESDLRDLKKEHSL
ncbi:DpnII family type II restriction endonuclease [Alienimonas chondri]|uniref:Restriction endonuclease type II DpnII-like domain-containing protein n=1 Tax=Alienimonas chondri TaxID=2681879 RepID=A0ABX1VJ23_9PLAN|nr:DpnII family type II restriction endonuclease [Alienimonas chondri]NNJ27456.1 hypothetical protein [Alienimonas chondri]